MLTSTEQNELHNLLRQQGNLTQDGCWDAIEVFEEFLKEKLKPLSDTEIEQTTQGMSEFGADMFKAGIRTAERARKIGEGNE